MWRNKGKQLHKCFWKKNPFNCMKKLHQNHSNLFKFSIITSFHWIFFFSLLIIYKFFFFFFKIKQSILNEKKNQWKKFFSANNWYGKIIGYHTGWAFSWSNTCSYNFCNFIFFCSLHLCYGSLLSSLKVS